MDISPTDGSFMFLWASERTGFMHLYLYRYVPGAQSAVEVRQVTSGDWVVESVVGVDQVSERRNVWLSFAWALRLSSTVDVSVFRCRVVNDVDCGENTYPSPVSFPPPPSNLLCAKTSTLSDDNRSVFEKRHCSTHSIMLLYCTVLYDICQCHNHTKNRLLPCLHCTEIGGLSHPGRVSNTVLFTVLVVHPVQTFYA